MMGLRWYHWVLIVAWAGFSTVTSTSGGPAHTLGYAAGSFLAVTGIVWTAVYLWRRDESEPEGTPTQNAK